MYSTLPAAQPYSEITILLKSLDKGQLQCPKCWLMLSQLLNVFTQLYAYGEISTKEPQCGPITAKFQLEIKVLGLLLKMKAT